MDQLTPGTMAGTEFDATAGATDATAVSDGWLDSVRSTVAEPGEYLAYLDGPRAVVVPLTREWTRIGRSLAANVRFDDPTVSRRHALVVRGADGVRVLDDRSLNGVFVNGERIEWGLLSDGDEIAVGRHMLHFIVADPLDVRSSDDGHAAILAE